MSKRINVNPDHYKTEGRLRPDDAASARFSRAISAKVASRQRPGRMEQENYFERPRPAPATGEKTPNRAAKTTPSRSKAAKKESGTRKRSAPRRTAAPGKAAAHSAKKRGARSPRPDKKR